MNKEQKEIMKRIEKLFEKHKDIIEENLGEFIDDVDKEEEYIRLWRHPFQLYELYSNNYSRIYEAYMDNKDRYEDIKEARQLKQDIVEYLQTIRNDLPPIKSIHDELKQRKS